MTPLRSGLAMLSALKEALKEACAFLSADEEEFRPRPLSGSRRPWRSAVVRERRDPTPRHPRARAAARFVGYLEEEAVKTYTDILAAVDDGISDLRCACQLHLSL